MISLETLKLFKMYLDRTKENFKTDTSISAIDNLSNYVALSLRIDIVTELICQMEEAQS